MLERRHFFRLAGSVALAATTDASGARTVSGGPRREHGDDGRKAARDIVDVAIVGGGLSGLVAARTLRDAGIASIAVLEARDRVGGRTFNQDIGSGHVGEAGGTWVGPGQTAIADLMRELGIETFPTYTKGDTMVFLDGETARVSTTASPVNDAAFYARMNALAATVPTDAPWTAARAAEWDQMTYADYLKSVSLSDDDALGLSLSTQLTFGAPADQLSLLYVLFYIHAAGKYELLESVAGGAQQDRIVGGSQLVSLKLADRLGGIVRLSTPVVRIANWNGAGPVVLETAAGEVLAQRVILALSPSQAEAIAFEPALPPQRAALQSAWPSAGTGVKSHTSYTRPFWRDRHLNGEIYSTDRDFLWTLDASPPDGSIGALVTFSASRGQTKEEQQAKNLALYEKCFGREAREATGFVMQDWSAETYTRGCVSPVGPGVLTKYGAALKASTGGLIWSGTETASIWMGYMDGAVRAGKRAALEAIAALVQLRA